MSRRRENMLNGRLWSIFDIGKRERAFCNDLSCECPDKEENAEAIEVLEDIGEYSY